MSTPLSSAPRATPGMSVPASQNTAPVIKFRCLYTHDMRRKAKRWQDGYLRYHTFNKRIMAYDITGNFIGDLHWRQGDAIQDGDELELDRGVLIQVCEPMEKTETDISGLYGNKKSQGSPSRPEEPPTPSLRTSTPLRPSTGSQSSRSLNDLLGIKKTPTGRFVSPYEERHPSQQSKDHAQPPERAVKRQRLAPENVPRAHGSGRAQPVTIDLSEEPPAVRPTATAADIESPVQPKKIPSSVKAPATVSRSDKTPSSRAQPISTETQNPVNNAPPPAKKSSTIRVDAPVNTLRLSTERPRRKLMYSALLPGQTTAKVSMPSPLSEKTNAPVRENPQEINLTSPDPVPTNPDFIPSASTLAALDEMPSESARGPDRTAASHGIQGTLPKSGSTSLRKSYSDPTALTTATSVRPRSLPFKSPLNRCIEEEEPREQGPWTSEALDLFDFWPPGRAKPT
ncbi:hypothetical protein ABOM_009582 [Aspergillus bombycis]|uniref:5'-3' DNA helicase ZGRF1-like N-terminal domain-containing protein n=1 Tax=Aspergillus bombycis TaxID=109264 RepID=A0A1F7ZT37_9EURO|nr:hypothetical protein ABOM_009582 [Aspergillus bombycis]OGM42616.1 hypothetical protein ABOM_009582 [Aspergillus bombycis]